MQIIGKYKYTYFRAPNVMLNPEKWMVRFVNHMSPVGAGEGAGTRAGIPTEQLMQFSNRMLALKVSPVLFYCYFAQENSFT